MTPTRLQPADFRYTDRLRVRWAEIDAQQIVFNGHYLTYVDTALAGYWRALALPYAATMRSLGGDLYVRKATLEYLASARYDDLLDIGVRCGRIGTSSIQFAATVFRQGHALVTAELVYVYAEPSTQTSQPVPAALRDTLQAFERGAEMLDVRLGPWETLGEASRAVRAAVFIDEQAMPATMVEDATDPDALHAVAFNRMGVPLATGRLVQTEPSIACLGRMASLQAVRGSGLGRRVLAALMQAARRRGDGEMQLHARTSARAFYERAGFTASGAIFEEAGLAHIEMSRRLEATS